MNCREHLEICFSNNFCAGQKMSTYSNVGHAQPITHRLYELYEVIGGQLGLLTWLSTCSWMSFFLGCLLAAGFRLDELFWWWQLAPDCLFHHSQLYWSCVTHFQVLRQVPGEKMVAKNRPLVTARIVNPWAVPYACAPNCLWDKEQLEVQPWKPLLLEEDTSHPLSLDTIIVICAPALCSGCS